MKIKPKEIMVNLPAVQTFALADDIPALASAVNSIIHGNSKVKYEELGMLGGSHVGIFYLKRNDEFSELRESFMVMIEKEEMAVAKAASEGWTNKPLTDEEKKIMELAKFQEEIGKTEEDG